MLGMKNVGGLLHPGDLFQIAKTIGLVNAQGLNIQTNDPQKRQGLGNAAFDDKSGHRLFRGSQLDCRHAAKRSAHHHQLAGAALTSQPGQHPGQNTMRVPEHGGNGGGAGAVPIPAIVNSQEIDPLLVVLGPGIVIIGNHLAIAMEKKKIHRSRVAGQKESGSQHYPWLHLYPMILGANRWWRRVVPGVKERSRNLGPVKFFVCSCLLHILPLDYAQNSFRPPLLSGPDIFSTIPTQNGNIYPIFFAFSLHSFGVSGMTVLTAAKSVHLFKKHSTFPVSSQPMHLNFLQINFLLMYFIYGLALFSMGLAMALEVSHSPDVAEATLLKPLAVFGILNALNQWLEIIILPDVWQEIAPPKPLLLTKLLLLTLSFASLTAFGVQAYRPVRRQVAASLYVSLGFLLAYFIAIGINHILPWKTTPNCLRCADALARYLLALPGAMLAALALKNHALKNKALNAPLARSYRLAAWGFALFGLTQIFPPRAEIYPAPFVNAELFQEITGMPIQLISMLLALFTMGNLIHASHLAEKGRQQKLHQAQQEKLAALEQVQEELLKRRALRKDLFRHIVLAQEEERSRISRELHDDTAQILTAATLNMAALKTVVGDNPKAITLLERSQNLCQEMSQALYRMVHDLRPAQLDDFGLVPALRHLTEEKWFSRKIAISFEVLGEQRRVEPVIETVLFRVAQEALTNILRHAHTDAATIRILFEKEQITLTVADQGKGFIPALKGQGFGLAGITERVELINGRVEIDSAPGKGTTVTVIAPARPGGVLPPAAGQETAAGPSSAPPEA